MHPHIFIDKSISVKPGGVVKTGYVKTENVVLLCKDPMSKGDISEKYELVKQNAPNQIFPCPIGHFREDGRFVILDGRHTFIALVMNGFESILVSWIDNEK
ncbi:hypothetical protein [Dyadobacter sandarakinus]|uniref:ParB/Sulfiredoxin domain-containing protein n=1 Tax=Dyadobacter sandarakinus TaxID=2747268 RepID=A0ABX7I1P7_9BACT|nr:hypothetical protein [Dyadobacter sandarakinus]QRQ99694.1 hypothetical protein HWI92_01575 [Dyadobacter sandarakinus]